MGRSRDPHPLGKCAEERLDIPMPAELKEKLSMLASLHRLNATAYAREILEKVIEGEWVFIQRRVDRRRPDDSGINTP